MGQQKLIDKLNRIFDLDAKKQKKKRDKLFKLMKKLKKHYKALEKELSATEDSSKQKEIEQNLKVLRLQREKTIALCKKLKCKK